MLNPNDKAKDSARESVEDGDADGLQTMLRGDRMIGLPFPITLHDLLDDTEANREDDIVSFLPDGKSFAVHKPHKFIQNIMPRYFKTNKIKSFQRQLLLYGFKRVIGEGCTKPGYYHDLFVKGNKSLSLGMMRKPKQSNQLSQRLQTTNTNLSSQFEGKRINETTKGQPSDFQHSAGYSPSENSTTLSSHQPAATRSRNVPSREISIYVSPQGRSSNVLMNQASGACMPSERGGENQQLAVASPSGSNIRREQLLLNNASPLHNWRADTSRILPLLAGLDPTLQTSGLMSTQSPLEAQNLQRSQWTDILQEQLRSTFTTALPSFTIGSARAAAAAAVGAAGAAFDTSEAVRRRMLLDQEQQRSLLVAGSDLLQMARIAEEQTVTEDIVRLQEQRNTTSNAGDVTHLQNDTSTDT